jgi:hypothetical protein
MSSAGGVVSPEAASVVKLRKVGFSNPADLCYLQNIMSLDRIGQKGMNKKNPPRIDSWKDFRIGPQRERFSQSLKGDAVIGSEEAVMQRLG